MAREDDDGLPPPPLTFRSRDSSCRIAAVGIRRGGVAAAAGLLLRWGPATDMGPIRPRALLAVERCGSGRRGRRISPRPAGTTGGRTTKASTTVTAAAAPSSSSSPRRRIARRSGGGGGCIFVEVAAIARGQGSLHV